MIKQKILGVDVEITKQNIKIKNSFKVNNKETMLTILKIVRNVAMKKGLTFKRTNDSWIKEWKAHNFLYKLHLFEENTRDTDLEENESKFRLFCYEIIGR